jgi:hypothetical protein
MSNDKPEEQAIEKTNENNKEPVIEKTNENNKEKTNENNKEPVIEKTNENNKEPVIEKTKENNKENNKNSLMKKKYICEKIKDVGYLDHYKEKYIEIKDIFINHGLKNTIIVNGDGLRINLDIIKNETVINEVYDYIKLNIENV